MIMRGLRAFLLLTGLWHSSCRLVWVEVIRPAGAGFVLARWLAGDGRDSFNTPAAPSLDSGFRLPAAGRRRSTTYIPVGVPSRRIPDILSINDAGQEFTLWQTRYSREKVRAHLPPPAGAP